MREPGRGCSQLREERRERERGEWPEPLGLRRVGEGERGGRVRKVSLKLLQSLGLARSLSRSR